ncbi:MAG: hypothetical protein LBJ92_00200 [Holosporales bacterium]|jgi:hypothetical protein|nr:hypothetical protein [Holosporales bacterium]
MIGRTFEMIRNPRSTTAIVLSIIAILVGQSALGAVRGPNGEPPYRLLSRDYLEAAAPTCHQDFVQSEAKRKKAAEAAARRGLPVEEYVARHEPPPTLPTHWKSGEILRRIIAFHPPTAGRVSDAVGTVVILPPEIVQAMDTIHLDPSAKKALALVDLVVGQMGELFLDAFVDELWYWKCTGTFHRVREEPLMTLRVLSGKKRSVIGAGPKLTEKEIRQLLSNIAQNPDRLNPSPENPHLPVWAVEMEKGYPKAGIPTDFTARDLSVELNALLENPDAEIIVQTFPLLFRVVETSTPFTRSLRAALSHQVTVGLPPPPPVKREKRPPPPQRPKKVTTGNPVPQIQPDRPASGYTD